MHLERYYQFESLCNSLITKKQSVQIPLKFHTFTPSPIITAVENDHLGRQQLIIQGPIFPPPWEGYHTLGIPKPFPPRSIRNINGGKMKLMASVEISRRYRHEDVPLSFLHFEQNWYVIVFFAMLIGLAKYRKGLKRPSPSDL